MGSEAVFQGRKPTSAARWSIPLHVRCPLFAAAAGLPAVVVSFLLLGPWAMAFDRKWAIGVLILAVWLGFVWRTRLEIYRPLLLLSGILRSLEEGDYSVRLVQPDDRGELLAGLIASINALAEHLRSHRLHATETALLLDSITNEIDAAIFTFDNERRVTFVNRAGEHLLECDRMVILGKSIGALGLEALLDRATAPDHLSGAAGKRWDVKRKTFYSGGRQHTLIVVTDVTQPLRQEERLAWQRLIRVLGHEINNSLTPIRSLSSHLISLVDDAPDSADAKTDLKAGLTLMANRSAALSRFISGFARMANIPAPQKAAVDIKNLLERLAALEWAVRLEIRRGTEVVIQADSDQIEQVIINLLKNAADASSQANGSIEISWRVERNRLYLSIRDEGPGLSSTQNLFVPFYTTKAGGSGIGLVLSRQIVEAHGGILLLTNRTDRPGCEAVLELPLA